MACECELQNNLDVDVTKDALLDVEIGGSAGVLLQAKSVDIAENGTIVVAPDDGFDGLKSVEINTNVPKRFECGDAYFLPITSAQKNVSLISRLQKLYISCWDVSSYTNMNSMFINYSSLQSIDVSKWNTSSVTNMGSMFYGCSSLQYLDVSGWDTSNVTIILNMFNGCSSLQSLDVSRFDVSKVKNFEAIFFRCTSLQSLDVSKWDTSSATYIYATFARLKLKMLDFSGWNVSNATNIDRLLEECYNLKTIIGDKTLQDVENGTVALRGTKVNIRTNYSPLRFSSILALANGLADLTGATAKTLVISAQSYKNMYNDDDTVPTADVIAERQARIAAICAAKNWNFAH